MQQSKNATVLPSLVQYPNNAVAPNQLKLTTNFNFHIDDEGKLGRVDVRKALCYQSQDLTNNILTKKVLLMKKTPIVMSPPNIKQNFVDCNNNLNPPTTEQQMPPPHIHPQKLLAHHLSPLNINTQFHTSQFAKQLNWNQSQFH